MKPPPSPVPKPLGLGAIMLADWEKKAGPDGQAMVAAYRKK